MDFIAQVRGIQRALSAIDRQFEEIVRKAFDLTLNECIEHIQTNFIQEERWIWPRQTKRKSGRVVKSGRRDIVDLGVLLQSCSTIKGSIQGGQIRGAVLNTARYASIVENGYVTRTGAVYPPRPFLRDGLTDFNFQSRLQENLVKVIK